MDKITKANFPHRPDLLRGHLPSATIYPMRYGVLLLLILTLGCAEPETMSDEERRAAYEEWVKEREADPNWEEWNEIYEDMDAYEKGIW